MKHKTLNQHRLAAIFRIRGQHIANHWLRNLFYMEARSYGYDESRSLSANVHAVFMGT